MKVRNLRIREVLASNSEKTIEVELKTEMGTVRASVPMGTSKGRYEVIYLPVDAAIRKFTIIARQFKSQEFSKQEEVDDFLRTIDNTPNFKDIGGNVALAISSAFLKAFASHNFQEVYQFLGKPSIPKPLCNVVGGWKGQSNIQEFLLIPVHQKSFLESISKIAKIYLEIGNRLKKLDKNFNFGKNLESAWITSLHHEKVLEMLRQIANENLLKIGLDVAAAGFWDGEFYNYSTGNLNTEEQRSFIEDLARRYSIYYIEDPFNEDDMTSFGALTSRMRDRLICGDDLYSTNMIRLKNGLSYKATNTIIIKPNQVGTITDTIKVVKEAKKNNMTTVMSHRSAETDDALICHLAAGLNCDYIKIGISGERIDKINEMIRIEQNRV